MVKAIFYTEEEVEIITRKLDELIAKAADGRFNAETNPRETCKYLQEELKVVRDYITNGCCNFAKKSELHTHYSDSHFI